MNDKKLILAIDFNNFIFANYYSQKLFNRNGKNINAIKGTFFKLKMLKEMFNPDYIVFASDLSREKTFRRKLYKKYKAQRKPTDEDIIFQMKYISQLIALLGYKILNNETYEADDILGMISKYGTDNNMETVIVSSDRDLYQLINDNTFIMSPRGKNEVVDIAYLVENYIPMPYKWVVLKTLPGDPSDNIPGIPGIGEITALKLMQEYDSIDGIYDSIKEMKPSVQKLLRAGIDTIDLTKQLVTIITDYNLIGLNEDMLIREECYPKECIDTILELEIPSLINIFNYSLFDKPIYIDQSSIAGSNETFMLP